MERWRTTYLCVVLLIAPGLAGCIEKETDPRKVEEAVEEAMQRDTTVRSLEARIDSLERSLAAVLAQEGREGEGGTPESVDGERRPPQAEQPPREEPGRVRGSADAPATRGAETLPEQVRYETYRNERLGYSIDYPANVLEPVEALGSGNGYRFGGAGVRATLAVYGVEGVTDPQALRDLYREELEAPGRRVTYKTVHDDWFVISGYRGDRIFYERTLLRGGVLKTFLLVYDADLQPYFEPITEHVSFSFEG